MSHLSRRERSELCDEWVERLRPSGSATSRELCRRTGEVMSELLGARVELRFAAMRGVPFSGVTIRLTDGGYVVYCASSRSWYHRLGILLHELAHVLLEHQPVTTADRHGLRRFAPHLPGKVALIVAGRTSHTGDQEREAEEVADLLLERLTERCGSDVDLPSVEVPPYVRRIAESLAHYPSSHHRR